MHLSRIPFSSYIDTDNADIFALTRERRRARKAWTACNVGSAKYWGSQEAADRAVERYERWRIEARLESAATRAAAKAHHITKKTRQAATMKPAQMPKLAVLLFELQDGRCYLSGEPFTIMNPPTWEHVLPKSKGGINQRNLLLAGHGPNNAKGNRLPYPCEIIYLDAIMAQIDAKKGLISPNKR